MAESSDGLTKQSVYVTDYHTTTDFLNFSDFTLSLAEILQDAANTAYRGRFWRVGSGKTSLMRMLKEQIDKIGHPYMRTVWFTAWKYDHQDALWRAFILPRVGRIVSTCQPRRGAPSV